MGKGVIELNYLSDDYLHLQDVMQLVHLVLRLHLACVVTTMNIQTFSQNIAYADGKISVSWIQTDVESMTLPVKQQWQ